MSYFSASFLIRDCCEPAFMSVVAAVSVADICSSLWNRTTRNLSASARPVDLNPVDDDGAVVRAADFMRRMIAFVTHRYSLLAFILATQEIRKRLAMPTIKTASSKCFTKLRSGV